MRSMAFRMLPGEDLKKGIVDYCRKHGLSSGTVMTVVGSLSKAVIRLADGRTVREFEKNFEIVSMTGTVGINGCHFHIAVSDEEGNVLGGHLMEGSVIRTTAEVVLADLSEEFDFRREFDPATDYNELVVIEK